MAGHALLLMVGFAVGACGSSGPTPPAPGSAVAVAVVAAPIAAAAKGNTPTGLCARLCGKALQCLGVGDTELASCTSACAAQAPDQGKVEQLEAGDCQDVLAVLKSKPAAGTGCTADCRGCASDGTSCYAVAGGANGIPCDPCCCAPGGPSPTWKTE